MKKIIGFIICILLITTSGFSVVGIDENRDELKMNSTGLIMEESPLPTGLFEWPMFRYGLNNSGFSPSLAPDDDTVLWSKYIGDWVDSNPTIKDERLYIVRDNYWQQGGDDIWCLNPFDGSVIWKTNIPTDFVWGSPTVANDKVYVLGTDFYLYCYDAYTGDKLWHVQADGHCSPMVVDDKVYFGSYGYLGFHCLNASTGEEIWEFDPSIAYQGCTPAIANGNVYIGNDEGIFYCLNADTSDVIWSYDTQINDYLWSSPSVYNNKVYFSANNGPVNGGGFLCLNASTGDEIWTDEIETHSSPAVAYGNVYIGNGHNSDGKVYCFNPETGDLIWDSQSLGISTWNGAAVADGKLYTCSNGYPGKFNCLDAFTGDIIWQYEPISTGSYSSPAVAYGNVYVGSSEDGYIYAFGTPNDAPEIPAKPDGPDNGKTNMEYIFNSTTTDPEDDDIYYLFDWDDGYNSGWIGPYTSGEEVSASHIWTEIGDYEIRVKTHDGRRESDWSKTLTIHITTLPPDGPSIDGPPSGKPGVSYNFTFNSVDPEGDDVYYSIKWGDGATEDWDGPHSSGEDLEIAHAYPLQKTFTIEAKAKDTSDAESDWTYFDIEIPRTRAIFNSLFLQLLERFIDTFPIMRYLFRLMV